MQQTIKIVDNLAEITSHYDRQILEKSLLKTLNELFPESDLRLYRVRSEKPTEVEHDMSLLAYCVNSIIVSTEVEQKAVMGNAELVNAIQQAFAVGDIQFVKRANRQGWYIIYPAFDGHGDIFAVMLMTCSEMPSASDQRLVYGIIKVYSNYLSLIEKSQRDKLTGLYNRETLDAEITKLLVGQEDEFIEEVPTVEGELRKPLSTLRYWLSVIDIDHFKAINDSFGHLYGDEVIILVARLMTSGCMRDDDRVFRYGGEEFVILIKAAEEEDARTAFERIRKTVAEHAFPQLQRVTVSIGFVEVSQQQTASDVIGEADEALYFSKLNGRNQVQSYRELLELGKVKKVARPTSAGDVELF